MRAIAETRTKILLVAQELFYRHGFEAMGVKEICSQAGVSKSSFYHFYPSKEDLVLAVIDSRWQTLQGYFAQLRASSLSPLGQLRQSFDLMYRISEQTYAEQGVVLGCPFGSLGSELGPLSPRVQGAIAAVLDGMERTYREMLEAAVVTGELNAGFAAGQAATAILTAVQGMGVMGKVYNSPQRLRQAGEALLDVILC